MNAAVLLQHAVIVTAKPYTTVDCECTDDVQLGDAHNAAQDVDHVKFGFGSSGRAARVADSFGGGLAVKTLLLNPTAIDSMSETTNLRLAIELAEDMYDGKPLADFVWYSQRPKVNQLTRLMNEDDAGPIWARIKLGYD